MVGFSIVGPAQKSAKSTEDSLTYLGVCRGTFTKSTFRVSGRTEPGRGDPGTERGGPLGAGGPRAGQGGGFRGRAGLPPSTRTTQPRKEGRVSRVATWSGVGGGGSSGGGRGRARRIPKCLRKSQNRIRQEGSYHKARRWPRALQALSPLMLTKAC